MLVPSEVTSVFTSQQRQAGVDEPHVLDLQRRFVGGQEQRDLVLDRHLERIAPHGRDPGAFTGVTGASSTFRACTARAARDMTMASSAAPLCAGTGHDARRGETPAAVDQCPHAKAA